MLPETSENIGTIHTHPYGSFFSPLDFATFIIKKDIVMAVINPDGNIFMMFKTKDIPILDKIKVIKNYSGIFRNNITRRLNIKNEQDAFREITEKHRYVLDSCKDLDITIVYGKVG